MCCNAFCGRAYGLQYTPSYFHHSSPKSIGITVQLWRARYALLLLLILRCPLQIMLMPATLARTEWFLDDLEAKIAKEKSVQETQRILAADES